MDPAPGARIRASGLTKVYPSGSGTIRVLDGLDLTIEAGEQVALVGESGAGKTTLLHILGGLDRPTTGTVTIGGVDLTALDADALAGFRNQQIGFVWQQASLLPEFTALENVTLPLRIRGLGALETERRAIESLEDVGLRARATHRAGELSGGEQQRVVLARALAARPQVLLADEPTGNLDVRTADRIIELLKELHRRYRLTSVIVTHNPDFAARCDRTVVLHDGRVSGLTMENRSYV